MYLPQSPPYQPVLSLLSPQSSSLCLPPSSHLTLPDSSRCVCEGSEWSGLSACRHQQRWAAASGCVCVCVCVSMLRWLALCPDPPPVVKLTPFLLSSLDCCPDCSAHMHTLTHTHRHGNTSIDNTTKRQMLVFNTQTEVKEEINAKILPPISSFHLFCTCGMYLYKLALICVYFFSACACECVFSSVVIVWMNNGSHFRPLSFSTKCVYHSV